MNLSNNNEYNRFAVVTFYIMLLFIDTHYLVFDCV